MSGTDVMKVAADRGLLAFTEAADVFSNEAAAMGVQNGQYISFSGKTGRWAIKGQEVDPGTCFAFHMLACQKGWRAWKNEKPVEQIWSNFVNGEPLPAEKDLTNHWPNGKEHTTDGWQSVIKIDIRDLEGGPQMDLTLPSEKPWRPVWRLIKEFGDKAKLNRDDKGQYKIPVVEIGTEQVKGKSGTFFAPTFKIVDWLSEQDMAERVGEFLDANSPAEEVVEEVVEKVTEVIPPPARAPTRTAPGIRR
jgi:hypothetical protein